MNFYWARFLNCKIFNILFSTFLLIEENTSLQDKNRSKDWTKTVLPHRTIRWYSLGEKLQRRRGSVPGKKYLPSISFFREYCLICGVLSSSVYVSVRTGWYKYSQNERFLPFFHFFPPLFWIKVDLVGNCAKSGLLRS